MKSINKVSGTAKQLWFERGLVPLLLAAALFVPLTRCAAAGLIESRAGVPTDDPEADFAPIVERKLNYYNFSYRTVEGAAFDLRDYAQGKSVIVVEYFAGWCKNSNRNGHVRRASMDQVPGSGAWCSRGC